MPKVRKPRPFWQVVLYHREDRPWPGNPLREDFKSYHKAFCDFLECQQERRHFRIALYRVQPLHRSDPNYCLITNSEKRTLLAGEEPPRE